MKRLTTFALLAGIPSAPALHGEETPADRSAQLNSCCRTRLPIARRMKAPRLLRRRRNPNRQRRRLLPAMPPVSNPAPDVVPLTPIVGGSLNLAQMGMPDGIMLSGGQLQGGASFTLPSDQVVTHAELMLDVRVSPEMAARNATLQLMLNGQPLGTVPLGTDGADISHFQLDNLGGADGFEQ